MSKKLSNLEKIREAEKIGYLATIKYKWTNGIKEYQVIDIDEDEITIKHKGLHLYISEESSVDIVEITGYLYAGELAGNEPIPEGQKFRVKETGDIGTPSKNHEQENNYHNDCIWLELSDSSMYQYDKSEIEPILND